MCQEMIRFTLITLCLAAQAYGQGLDAVRVASNLSSAIYVTAPPGDVGRLFSPRSGDDHNLYITTGDGGSAYDQGTGHIEPGGNAQSLVTLLGKILRIHVNSTTAAVSIPLNNPFYGNGTYRQEIWASGLRNA